MRENESGYPLTAVTAAFLLTIAAICLLSYVPHLRVWGLAAWAHLGTWPPIAAAIIAIASAGVILRAPIADHPAVPSRGTYLLVASAAIAVLGATFILLRTRTHFLGDGYTVLNLLAADDPLIKGREIGEAMAHVWVKDLSGLRGAEGALLSFRIVSVVAGLLFASAVFAAARRLFEDLAARLLFAGGLLCGGYMLLFFGYVENYSLFVLSVGLFVLTGLIIARGGCARWWILPPLALASLMHILGVTLLPAAVYLLGAGTKTARRLSRLPRWVRWFAPAAVVVAGLAAMAALRESNPFVRFSLLRLAADRFTVDGYILFAPAHLIDMANLLFLLVPSLLLAAAAVWRRSTIGVWSDRGVRFASVAAVSAIGAIFLFDPKLGMPRDWDLFSYAGVPLAALVMLLILSLPLSRRLRMRLGAAAVVLGMVSLAGRVAVQNTPSAGVAQFENHMHLDFRRGVNARVALVDYYLARGDTVLADTAQARWLRDFPEAKLVQDALAVKEAGHQEAAMAMFRRVLEMNPHAAGAWSNLGEMFVRLGMHDSAEVYLTTAIGLNPYEASAISNLGVLAIQRGEFRRAKDYLTAARRIRPDQPAILYNLAHVCRLLGEQDKCERYLADCAGLPDAPGVAFLDLGDLYLSRGHYQAAAEILRKGLARGLSKDAVADRIKRFPALAPYFRAQEPGESD